MSKKGFGLDPTDHDMDHHHRDHRLTGGGEVFIVFTQPAVFSKPAEGPFNDSPFGQQNKTLGMIR
jgi:hypothetical protein